MTCRVLPGNCLNVLPGLPENYFDSAVTDPPYDLTAGTKGGSGRSSLNLSHPAGRSRITTGGGFMGREWDATGIAFDPATWEAVLRVLKPGAHLLAFGGTRTWHRLACAIEDAGFEIRDSIDWIYGSGFPKSLDVSKAIDKAAGVAREVISEGSPVRRMIPGADQNRIGSWIKDNGREFVPAVTVLATPEAARWDGWGTALKPAHEPIILARKPLAGTVAANVLQHRTGALNIGGCRVAHADDADLKVSRSKNPGRADLATSGVYGRNRPQQSVNDSGRWPPNILLTHDQECRPAGSRKVRSGNSLQGSPRAGKIYSDAVNQVGPSPHYADADGMETVQAWDCAPGCPVAELDAQSGISKSTGGKGAASQRTALGGDVYGEYSHATLGQNAGGLGDIGGASRFFPAFRYQAKAPNSERPRLEDGTAWPTVKPLELMRWLARLVTPPAGLVLDPFAGTGTTGQACLAEGFSSVLIERDPVALELIRVRIPEHQ